MDFQPLQSNNPVIQRLSDEWIAIEQDIFTVEMLSNIFWNDICASSRDLLQPENRSIPAKVLEENGTWTTGHVRVKVSVEFCPDSRLEKGTLPTVV